MKIFFIILFSLIFIIIFPFYSIILAITSLLLAIFLNNVYLSIIEKSIVVKRYIENNKIFFSDSTSAGILIENTSILPIPIVYVSDYTSSALSLKQKEVFTISIPQKSKITLKFRVYGTKRGDHYLGPTILEIKDLLGISQITKEYDTTGFITVFPALLAHGEIEKSNLQPYGEIKNKLPIFEDITRIQGIREYQQGDEVRRINWKLSAKHNKLYVNYYTPTVSSSSVIILNLYHPDFDMKYPDFYEEFAIELATTIIFDLHQYNQEIGFVSNGEIRRKTSIQGKTLIENPNGIVELPTTSGNDHIMTIFETLARIYPQNKIDLYKMLNSISIKIPWGSALIVITPNIDYESLLYLAEIARKGHQVFLYNVHPNKSLQNYQSANIKSFNTLKQENTIQIERVM